MVIGTLIGAGAALPLINALPNRNIGFSVMGVAFGTIMMGATLVTFFSVREPGLTTAAKPKTGFFKSYATVFKTKPFIIILLTYMMCMIAISIVSATMIYYFKYIHNRENLTTVALLILLVTAMIFIPVAVRISKRIGIRSTNHPR